MKYISFFFCLTLILLVGCKKDDQAPNYRNWDLTGRLLEKGTNKGIPNATIHYLNCTSEFLGGTTCLEETSAVTDADGRYHLEFTGEAWNMWLDVTMHPSNAHTHGSFGDPVVVNHNDTDKDYNLEVLARSFLVLTIKNVRDTSINYAFSVKSPDYPSHFLNLKLGSQKDTVFNFNMYANQENRVSYTEVDSQGWLIENFKDTITCPPQDTLYHTITF